MQNMLYEPTTTRPPKRRAALVATQKFTPSKPRASGFKGSESIRGMYRSAISFKKEPIESFICTICGLNDGLFTSEQFIEHLKETGCIEKSRILFKCRFYDYGTEEHCGEEFNTIYGAECHVDSHKSDLYRRRICREFMPNAIAPTLMLMCGKILPPSSVAGHKAESHVGYWEHPVSKIKPRAPKSRKVSTLKRPQTPEHKPQLSEERVEESSHHNCECRSSSGSALSEICSDDEDMSTISEPESGLVVPNLNNTPVTVDSRIPYPQISNLSSYARGMSPFSGYGHTTSATGFSSDTLAPNTLQYFVPRPTAPFPSYYPQLTSIPFIPTTMPRTDAFELRYSAALSMVNPPFSDPTLAIPPLGDPASLSSCNNESHIGDNMYY